MKDIIDRSKKYKTINYKKEVKMKEALEVCIFFNNPIYNSWRSI